MHPNNMETNPPYPHPHATAANNASHGSKALNLCFFCSWGNTRPWARYDLPLVLNYLGR